MQISHDPAIAGKQIAALLQGTRAETLLGPEEFLAEAITRILVRPSCPYCGEAIPHENGPDSCSGVPFNKPLQTPSPLDE